MTFSTKIRHGSAEHGSQSILAVLTASNSGLQTSVRERTANKYMSRRLGFNKLLPSHFLILLGQKSNKGQ